MLFRSIANVVTWVYVGYNMLIIYSALLAIPQEIYEAARLDGAGQIRIAWSIKVPIAIAMYTGLRKADALALEKGERMGDAIRTSKTGEEVTILIHPELRVILDGAPAHKAKTLAANQGGTTWTSNSRSICAT